MKYIMTILLLSVAAISFCLPPRTVTGAVSDGNGNPLGFVSVTVKGTSRSVLTSKEGKFSILLPNGNETLIFSAVGFLTREIQPGERTNLKITLSAAHTTLDEVVVTGYGAPMKREVMAANIAQAGSLNRMAVAGRIDGFRDRRYYYSPEPSDREGYDHITDNSFAAVTDNPLSTFSIDVDGAAYSNIRRMLNSNRLPEEGAVRIEEMLNYFSYQYEQPTGTDPFAVHMELGACPWNPQHQLALIGLQGKKISADKLPPSNLVFLIDVSGSMMSDDKLPLVKQSLKLLVDQLREEDRVSLVVYAGNAGLVLPPTSGEDKMKIKDAIERLEAGGSTAGGAGIKLAYETAKRNFVRKGNNRVILCTDGDFNVGLSSDAALESMIEEERKSGVFLTVLGFGTGNYQDAKMQKLADKGNGNHAYIDQLNEAKKVLISEFGGTLFTIAKDVKLQVEFNPTKIKGYRLIGYENRLLSKEDFNDDRKDAGDMGSGHTVTALYELVPAGADIPEAVKVDPLRYQTKLTAIPVGHTGFEDEVLQVKLRYKQPDGDKSMLLSFLLKNKPKPIAQTSTNFRFAASVASFGMLLRNSKYKGNSSYESVLAMAEKSLGADAEGYRKEFLQLVNKAAMISKREMAKE